MTILMGKLHEALRAANVPESLAREAAEEAATGYSKLEAGLNAVRLEMEKGFANVRQEVAVLRAETKGELRRLEWMLGGLLAIALAIGTRYFLHG